MGKGLSGLFFQACPWMDPHFIVFWTSTQYPCSCNVYLQALTFQEGGGAQRLVFSSIPLDGSPFHCLLDFHTYPHSCNVYLQALTLSVKLLCSRILSHFGNMAAPMINAAEACELTLSMEDVEKRLVSHMALYGVAIVKDVAGQEELKNLQHWLSMDLGELVVSPAIVADDTLSRTCKGTAANGAPCKIATGKNMGMAFKHTRALRLGGSFCGLHQTGAPVTEFPGAVPVPRSIPLEAWDANAVALLGEKGRLHDRGLPGGKFAWGCRLLPGVHRCFQSLFPGVELCVGLDMPFFSPAKCGKPAMFPEPHVDRNEHLTSEKCWQAILYVWEADETSSTTVVLPKSHVELYPSIMKDKKCPKSHYVELHKLDSKKELLDAWKTGARRLAVPSGALVLWDSRLVHTGWAGGRRLAQPVCWEPASRRKDAARLRKVLYASRGLSTSHSAAEGRLHTVHGKTPTPVPASRVVLRNEAYTLLPTILPVGMRGKRSIQQAWESTADEVSTLIQAKLIKYL